MLRAQCLDRRIPERATLEAEIAAWQHQRNAAQARNTWLFDLERAQQKFQKRYPAPKSPAAILPLPHEPLIQAA